MNDKPNSLVSLMQLSSFKLLVLQCLFFFWGGVGGEGFFLHLTHPVLLGSILFPLWLNAY